MTLTATEKIKCALSEDKQKQILDALEEQFKKVAAKCDIDEGRDGDVVKATSIAASFGSFVREDTTIATVSESRKKDGYNITAETTYSPSLAMFIVTLMCCWPAGLAFYFMGKSAVGKAVAEALRKVKDNEEE